MRPDDMSPIKRIASRATRAVLSALPARAWMFHTFGRHGLTHQTCRFCDRGIGDVSGLWKYSIRHYACERCRAFWSRADTSRKV